MSNSIVVEQVSLQVASAPNNLQQTGAIVSQGGTTLAANASSFLTQASDLTALLKASNAITAATWASGVVTLTLQNPHGIAIGEAEPTQVTVALMTPAGYNGTFGATATGANTLTYPLATNPGAETVLGTLVDEDEQELTGAVTNFFAMGSSAGVYVLELGQGDPADGVTALTAYLLAPSKAFYTILLPMAWAGEPTFLALAKTYVAPTAKLYFFLPCTIAQYPTYSNVKSVACVLQTPGVSVTTEIDAAAAMWLILATMPTTANKVAPFLNRYLFGVTANPLTSAQITAANAGFACWVGTGAEGGISNTTLQGATFMDGNPFNYWYAADYAQINGDLLLSAAVINGANNPQAPLYYDQPGINTLAAVVQGLMNSMVSFGLATGTPVVTAVSFATYVAQNPLDFPNGVYKGLAVTFTPAKGFKQITFYFLISNLPSS